MISINNKFLFIHIPKTGGNSIQYCLQKYSDDKIVNNDKNYDTFEISNDALPISKHTSLNIYKDLLGKNVYDNLYKFCVVRNPWDMCISFYFSPHWGFKQIKWDENVFLEILNAEIKPYNHYTNFQEMDHIIRYEKLEQGFEYVLKNLNIPLEKLQVKNKSEHLNYKEYYNDNLKNLVYNKFKEEINYFNYEFEGEYNEFKNHFTIIIPSYNNIKWIEKCIDSAINQNYSNFDIIYIDDNSNDGSYELVENKYKNKIKIIRNHNRKYALANIVECIKISKDNTIIVTLDGDDWLKNNNVLNTLNNKYNGDVWMTYGSYEHDDGSRGIIGEYSIDTIKKNSFRNDSWYASHLRTFKKELFLLINDDDLRDDNGEYYKMAWDLAFQFPMLEMAGFRSKHVEDVLYVYNRNNPISDDKVNRQLQYETDVKLRSKTPYKNKKEL